MSSKASSHTNKMNSHLSKPNASALDTISLSQFQLNPQMHYQNHHYLHQNAQYKENIKEYYDRFIPQRNNCHIQFGNFIEDTDENEQEKMKGKQVEAQRITIDEMYRSVLLDKNMHKILNFTQKSNEKCHSSLIQQIQQNSESKYFKDEHHYIQSKIQKRQHDHQYRKINKDPYKVLDAPNLKDDFYLNLLEWSASNILAVALDKSLYFWNVASNRVSKFCDLTPNSISSVSWNPKGPQIALGTSEGSIQLWDVEKKSKINDYKTHSARVSSTSWGDGVLASGSKDRTIQLRDVREKCSKIVSKYSGHSQEVCSLKWSFGQNLLASGGNDNKLFVWSMKSTIPVCKFTSHCAAVKGIAWNPHNHGILASGGGTADRTIKFWNTLEQKMIDSIDTGSQVCNLMFSKNTKELVSTHGYSNNQIVLWRYPSLQKSAVITGHTSRVLFLAMSPNGENIVTGAGDETLRFWNVFPAVGHSSNDMNELEHVDLR